MSPGGRQRSSVGADSRHAARQRDAMPGKSGTTPHALLGLQAQAGNHAVSQLIGGEPLDPGLRVEMEARFGADFGSVRVHDDAQAHDGAAALHAKAFTHGEHIAFSAGRYGPAAGDGKRLLAHELAHVVQQRRGGVAPQAFASHAPHEQAADHAAHQAVSGVPVGDVGATGVGIARDEDESWAEALQRTAREAKAVVRDQIPPEYRGMARDAVDFAANSAAKMAVAPLGPTAIAMLPDDLGASLLHGAEAVATGQGSAPEPAMNLARDVGLRNLGRAKGVITQVTDLVDTVIWGATEARNLKQTAVAAASQQLGVDPEAAKATLQAVQNSVGMTFPALAALGSTDALADLGDLMKSAELKDAAGNASLTLPVSEGLDLVGKDLESALGVKPQAEDAFIFTEMEMGEIEGAIGIQFAGMFVGATEVKVALNVLGAASGVRGLVEAIRKNPNDFYEQPAFWSGFLGAALSILGFKGGALRNKFIAIALKSNMLLTAVPQCWQLYNDYQDDELQARDPEAYNKRINQDLSAIVKTVVNVLMQIASNRGAGKASGASPTDASPVATPAQPSQPTKPAQAAKPVQAAPPAKPATATPATVVPPASAPKTAAPRAKPAAAAPTAAEPGVVTPFKRDQPPARSAASKKLGKALDKQRPDQAGSVTPIGARSPGKPPPAEAQTMPKPVELAEPMAVGQTHGPGTAKARTGPRLVTASDAPVAMAGGGSGKGTAKPPSTSPTRGSASAGAGTSPKTRPAKPATTPTKPAPKARKKKASAVPAPTETATPAQMQARLKVIEASSVEADSKLRQGVHEGVLLTRKAIADGQLNSADAMMELLEKRLAAQGIAPDLSTQVRLDQASVQGKVGVDPGPGGKTRSETAALDRAHAEQTKPSRKDAQKAAVRSGERLGVEGGQAKAKADDITIIERDLPQKHKGDFGRGIDDIGQRGDKTLIVEHKYKRSKLGVSRDGTTVQMSNEWVGKKIAELRALGDHANADRLLTAAAEGKLQGVVYWTREWKSGPKTTARDAGYLTDRVPGIKVDNKGVIQYDGAEVARAYQQHLDWLKPGGVLDPTRIGNL